MDTNERMYSLRQAAEMIGLTKAGFRFRCNSLGIPLEKDEKGHVVVTAENLLRVRDRLTAESEPESSDEYFPKSGKELSGNSPSLSSKTESKAESFRKVERKTESSGSDVTDALIEMLRHELAEKNKQIASLTAQLEGVTEALRAAQRSLEGAQALHAATVHQLQEAKQEAATTRTEDGEAAPDDPSPSPSDDSGTRAPDPEDGDPVVPEPPKRSLWSRLFGRRT